MQAFTSILQSIRKRRGFETSKDFFEFLKARGLSCNYQHYVKIEKGATLPSNLVVNQIANALNRNDATALIHSYCSEIFPKHSFLFDEKEVPLKNNSQPSQIHQHATELSTVVNLSERQIGLLASSKGAYHLFLILTLSRNPVDLLDLKKIHNLKDRVGILEEAQLIAIEDGFIRTITTEYRFPKDESLNHYYDKFDRWDLEFTDDFNFESLLNKVMIRRISPRYLNVINHQIESLVGLVRLSDEADKVYNTEVLQFQIKLKKGKLPG